MFLVPAGVASLPRTLKLSQLTLCIATMASLLLRCAVVGSALAAAAAVPDEASDGRALQVRQ